MRDALDYLVKARPEAMGHFLAFQKEAGSRLDPRTRHLISLITRAHSQIESEFRKGLAQALREGCTAEEVIDALLLASPALGMERVAWAVEVILGMKLPEFDPGGKGRKAHKAPAWHDVMAAESLRPGESTHVDCKGHSVFVHRSEDEYRVYDSLCPHKAVDIPRHALKGRRLTCPKHKWVFDLATGDCIKKGDAPLRRWESKIENGRIMALW